MERVLLMLEGRCCSTWQCSVTKTSAKSSTVGVAATAEVGSGADAAACLGLRPSFW